MSPECRNGKRSLRAFMWLMESGVLIASWTVGVRVVCSRIPVFVVRRVQSDRSDYFTSL
jgi:hypothetical protein